MAERAITRLRNRVEEVRNLVCRCLSKVYTAVALTGPIGNNCSNTIASRIRRASVANKKRLRASKFLRTHGRGLVINYLGDDIEHS